MLVDTLEPIGKFLTQFGLAKIVELPKAEEPKPVPSVPPVTNNLTSWEKLIASVKDSSMTEAMKLACVAQAILESSRGTSRVTSECCNFWGIKMRPEIEGLAVGKVVKVTSEVEGCATFASFKSTEDAVKGWLKFLTREYYVGWEEHKDNSEEFMRHIGKSWCPRADYADVVIDLFPEARAILGAKEPTTPKKTGKIIAVCSGHSLNEPGAHSMLGAKEEVLNIQQANILKSELEKSGYNVKLVAGKTNDLVGRGEQAEDCDAFIELHHNSFDGITDPGTEVFCTTDSSAECRSIANKVCYSISNAIKSTNRGVKINNFTAIKTASKTGCPVVMLVESYFVNPYNQIEAEKRSAIAAMAIAKVLKETV